MRRHLPNIILAWGASLMALIAALLLSAAANRAHADEGLFIEGGAGINFDAGEIEALNEETGFRADLESAYTFQARAGSDQGYWGFFGEADYSKSEFGALTFDDEPVEPPDLQYNQLGLTGNVFFEADAWRVKPYAGAGLGVAFVSVEDQHRDAVDVGPFRVAVGDWCGVHQQFAGVRTAVAGGVSVYVEAKRKETFSCSFTGASANLGGHTELPAMYSATGGVRVTF